MSEQAIIERIRQERRNGELLGQLVDRYGAENVVKALGVRHVAGSLGVSDDIPGDWNGEVRDE